MRTGIGAVGLGLLLAGVAMAENGPASVTEEIVNAVETVGSPATVGLLTARLGLACTGTLVGCQTVLTAAHCFCGTSQTGSTCTSNTSIQYVYAQHGGLFRIADVTIHTGYEFAVRSDLALVHLDRPVDGVSPVPINDVGRPALGSSGLIVGFGITEETANDAGIKRQGLVRTAACRDVSDATHLCWNYDDASAGPPGTESNSCSGDSGGPLFMDFGSGLVVAGVTSGGSESCRFDNAFNADVFLDRSFIEDESGPYFGAPSCGEVAPAGEPLSPIFLVGAGSLDPSDPEDRYTIAVEPGTAALRIALNGHNSTDFDLYVRRGAPASPADYDCASFRESSFEYCELLAPRAGTLHLTVDRFAGAGDYQLVATTMGIGSAATSGCVERASSLRLHDGRFRISGAAYRQGTLSTFFVGNLCGTSSISDTALAFFFNSGKPVHEGFISIRDKCAAAAAAFSVELASASTRKFRIDVEDTFTGLTQSYENLSPGASSFFPVDNTSFSGSCAVVATAEEGG